MVLCDLWGVTVNVILHFPGSNTRKRRFTVKWKIKERRWGLHSLASRLVNGGVLTLIARNLSTMQFLFKPHQTYIHVYILCIPIRPSFPSQSTCYFPCARILILANRQCNSHPFLPFFFFSKM